MDENTINPLVSSLKISDTNQRPFITTGEIIDFAKVHPNTVALWRATKKIIPKDKIGPSFLYDREEVMDFLRQRAIKKIISEKKKLTKQKEGMENNIKQGGEKNE